LDAAAASSAESNHGIVNQERNMQTYILFTVITLVDPVTNKLTGVSQNSQEFSSQALCQAAKQMFDNTIQNDVHLARISWIVQK
jgi:hypothetical protein